LTRPGEGDRKCPNREVAVSRLALTVAAVVALLFVPGTVSAQQPTSKSAVLVSELVKLLEQQKLDAVAANRGPVDEYVGALYIPGSQLLVVNAKSSVPDRMKYLLIQKSYKDLYVELNGAVDQQSKVFISDLGANGLQFKREKNQPFDTVDATGKTISYDGEWRKAKMSEADYTKAYQQHDEAYSRMLQALIETLKKPS
jgi:hypothetical protein